MILSVRAARPAMPGEATCEPRGFVPARSQRVKLLQTANSQAFSITYLLCQRQVERLVSALRPIGTKTMLRDKLNDALKDAMRARDTAALGAIRLILAKLKEVDIAARTEANREGVPDDRILSMLQGMIKQRNESIVLYEKGNRADLADKEKAEIAVIERFLPQQMDDAAVEAAVARGRGRGRRQDGQGHGRGDGRAQGQVRRPDGLRQGLGGGEEGVGGLTVSPFSPRFSAGVSGAQTARGPS